MKGSVCRGEWQEQLLQWELFLLCESVQNRQLQCFLFFHLNSEENGKQS